MTFRILSCVVGGWCLLQVARSVDALFSVVLAAVSKIG